MRIQQVSIPIIISSLENHKEIKNSLLDLINKNRKKNFNAISNTDWLDNKNLNREYVNLFLRAAENHIKKVYEALGYLTYNIQNVWFQQYENDSYHSWHVHPASNFTNIYYLELPRKELVTEIKDPMNINKFLEIDLNEGDMITMPSHLIHRSPKNFCEKRKTVIAFNCSVYKPK
jgi:hypothetical protein